MNRDELQHFRAITSELSTWSAHAQAILEHRARSMEAAASAVASIRQDLQPIAIRGRVQWRALILRPADSRRLAAIAHHAALSPITEAEAGWMQRLAVEVSRALTEAKAASGLRRMFSNADTKQRADSAGDYLVRFHSWASGAAVPAVLTRVDDRHRQTPDVTVSAVLDPRVGLIARIADLGAPRLMSLSVVAELPRSISTVQRALGKEASHRKRAVEAGIEVRRSEAQRIIAEMPIDRLKDATRERIRTAPLTEAGFRTVQDVFIHQDRLHHLSGIGATTASRIRGAAQTLWQATYEEMPIRVDIAKPTTQTSELLRALSTWDATRKTRNATADLARVEALAPLARTLDRQASELLVIARDSTHDDFAAAVRAVDARAELVAKAERAAVPADPWQDFMSRPADYFAMLQELGFLTEDEAAVEGGLPEEVIEAVRRFELDTEHLTASLRGYQSFGARFALVQRKVIIGDEMGLGKTVEALAVLTHLRSKGAHHALVVCPAAVVTNWTREVQSKSALRAHRLHGQGRDSALRSWTRQGGVAVTTYESLGWLAPSLGDLDELACVVLDEAHYIKNPAAQRSQRSARLIDRADRAILLTGTPLENRVEEFRNLVGYVRPDLIVDATDLRPRLFRQQVAPAYLRRNQEDVLSELPELVEVDEWLPMSNADRVAYRDAVHAGNFAAMRQAAMLQGSQSEKVSRLVEIVQEAEDNGRRVIVFSHFLDVLREVHAALPGRVFGPLTGAVPAARRQEMVDSFSAAGQGAVLVSQILAGGVGLNIQAASVVVICEPQLKPTTEWQAIARARRMGQLQSVQVHRLLSEEGADLRVTQILAKKRELFADFAAISEIADTAPEAMDVSEAELVREVVEDERRRLFSGSAPERDTNAPV
ncbi:DEAD/DEAH box helicase [Microbacterium sp. CJ88]|uniref:DEAD/DEAH box helicase n=1 Tax=Microbacterium sp. CJ88 TaxID=3445672 RepID=UPI003F658B24